MQWEPKSSRCLLLEVTDGVNKIKAIEAEPIGVLNGTIDPGVKVNMFIYCSLCLVVMFIGRPLCVIELTLSVSLTCDGMCQSDMRWQVSV